jgi:hypothetical protein
MDLKPAYTKIGRIIEQILKRQVPVKTGALRASLKIRNVNTDGGITFVLEEKKYGIFTDMGTGPYRARTRGQWNPRPGKGKGGIKPRFWQTLSDKDQIRIQMIIEDELSKQIEIELQK